MGAETYLSSRISKLHIKDIMNVLNTSLHNLSTNLRNSNYDFPCLKKHCKHMKDDIGLDLLTKKGTYPYEYMNCVDKFNDTESPKYEDFYSKVCRKNISEMNINMRNIYGNILTYKLWANTMIYI